MKNTTKTFLLIKFLLLEFCSLFSQNETRINQPILPFQNIKLSFEVRTNDLISRLTLLEKISLMYENSQPIDRLNIPRYFYGNEALHGVVRPGKHTVFPQAIALSATWSPGLIYEVATAISDEARGHWNLLNQGKLQTEKYSDLLTFFSPTINMARDPRWGRTGETYGEDPFLTSLIGVEFIKGLQGNDSIYLKTVATPKHYIANNVEQDRFSCNANISERALREYYLPAFKAAVMQGKAQSIMSAYPSINKIPCTANHWLLSDILRGEWNFDGYVVSDCGAAANLFETHKYVQSYEAAAATAIKAGMDLECGGFLLRDYLQKALDQNLITINEIDTALKRVLKARFKLGLFDPVDKVAYNSISPEVIGCKKHQQLAYETACKSMVLLKNESQILPLKKDKIKSLAVIGHNADLCLYGEYSGIPKNKPISPLEGIRKIAGEKMVVNYVKRSIGLGEMSVISTVNLKSLKEENGLSATYFSNKDLKGTGKQRTDNEVNINNKENKPDPLVVSGPKSMRWEGYLVPETIGDYKLGVISDDGCRMWIDNVLVINDWSDHGATLNSITMRLEKGKKYSIKLEYFDSGGDYTCRLCWKTPEEGNIPFFNEIEAAKKSDVVIAIIGTVNEEHEGQDRSSLDLPGDQLQMLQAIAKVNHNIIAVLIGGNQYTISWIKENVLAILNAWFPGEQGGNAIANAIFGIYSPAGRLPLTYYEKIENIPAMDHYEISEGRTYMYYQGVPLWDFGFGLSYTSFAYNNLTIEKEKMSNNDSVKISFDITNTGNYDGDEVAQLYVTFPYSKVQRPIKQLKGFKRVPVLKDKTNHVTLTLFANDLTYWSVEKQKWETENLPVKIMIGSSSNDIRLTGNLFLEE